MHLTYRDLMDVPKPDLFGRLLPERQQVSLERETVGLHVRVLAWPAKLCGKRHWGTAVALTVLVIPNVATPRGRRTGGLSPVWRQASPVVLGTFR